MGHYRSALSNWLRGRRRAREPRDDKNGGASTSQAPPPVPSASGYESDDSRAPTWVSNGASELEASGLGSSRGRRSVSDSAVLEATQSNMRHMRSFVAMGAASHVSGQRLAQLPLVDTAPAPGTGKHRRSTWASWQEGVTRASSSSIDAAAAPTPIYPHEHQPHQHPHHHHHSLHRFHLSRRISRRLSRQHTHHDMAQGGGSPEAVALTPAPSIIFIEC